MKNAFYKNLPDTPGVYLMKGARGKVLYVGKAGNLRRRVSSYFRAPQSSKSGVGYPTSPRLRGIGDPKMQQLLEFTKKIDYQKTDTAIEALILESQLIKKYEPQYNAREKDDKSFLYVEITKEMFPRVVLVRGKQLKGGLPRGARRAEWGPFTSATSIREALRIIRKIFPYSIHPLAKYEARSKKHVSGSTRRGCFDYELGLCPGTCIGAISRTEYLKNIRNIKLFLNGKKKPLLKKLEKEMKEASKKLEFEKATGLRRQIFALKHIRDVALIVDEKIQIPSTKFQRIEGYDISNISGTSAVGSMVVFSASLARAGTAEGGGPASGWESAEPNTDEYRKFRISTIASSDDVGMIKEVLRRRFNNPWPYPALILIDGGKGQVNAVKSVLNEFGLDLPVAGIAKGPSRKKNDFFGYRPSKEEEKVLVKIRDEAHRFALNYHRKLRGARALKG